VTFFNVSPADDSSQDQRPIPEKNDLTPEEIPESVDKPDDSVPVG
jgi:hypothetical protein